MRLTHPVPTMQIATMRTVFADEAKARTELEATAKLMTEAVRQARANSKNPARI